MYTCSITGIPFQAKQKAVLIPVLINKNYTDANVSNANVRPFPASVKGYFNEENFYIDESDKENEKFIMNMISEIIGTKIIFENFLNLRGIEKEVQYNEKDYVISFFACHEQVFNSIITEFKIFSYSHKKRVNFNTYSQNFINDVINELKFFSKLNVPYQTKLGSHRTGYVFANNFEEKHLANLAEVKFINSFLSDIGKKWEPSGVCSYNHELALQIYSKSILNLV